MVDTVSSTVREKWSDVFDMKIREFFNILSYTYDKGIYDKKRIEDYKKKN